MLVTLLLLFRERKREEVKEREETKV